MLAGFVDLAMPVNMSIKDVAMPKKTEAIGGAQ
jgi:hypothetical protein